MSQPKQPNKWLMLVNIPIQMGVTIFLFLKLGEYLDEYYDKLYFKKIMIVVGVFVSFVVVYNQVKKIND